MRLRVILTLQCVRVYEVDGAGHLDAQAHLAQVSHALGQAWRQTHHVVLRQNARESETERERKRTEHTFILINSLNNKTTSGQNHHVHTITISLNTRTLLFKKKQKKRKKKKEKKKNTLIQLQQDFSLACLCGINNPAIILILSKSILY